jgi:hypothetical protein
MEENRSNAKRRGRKTKNMTAREFMAMPTYKQKAAIRNVIKRKAAHVNKAYRLEQLKGIKQPENLLNFYRDLIGVSHFREVGVANRERATPESLELARVSGIHVRIISGEAVAKY